MTVGDPESAAGGRELKIGLLGFKNFFKPKT